jgi:hypothetical protein
MLYHYPLDTASYIPRNPTIQFMIADTATGINLHSVNAWINQSQFITNGMPESDTTVTITPQQFAYRFTYTPAVYLEADQDYDIRVIYADYAGMMCDTTWTFTTMEAVLDTSKQVTQLIGPTGAMFGDEGLKMGLLVPPEAVQDSVILSMNHVDQVPPLPEGWVNIGVNYHFGPDGILFNQSVTAGLPYTQSDLDASKVTHPSELTLFYFHSINKKWEQLPISQIDETLQGIAVELTEFCYLTYVAPASSPGMNSVDLEQPTEFKFYAPYPNPFNPETRLDYRLAQPGNTELTVYDLMGRKIKTLLNEEQRSGSYHTFWHGENDSGEKVASGTYIIVLKTPKGIKTQKVVMLK